MHLIEIILNLVGSGEKEKCELYRNVVFTFILTVYFVSSIIMAGIIFTISRTSNMDMKYTIGLILIGYYYNHYNG